VAAGGRASLVQLDVRRAAAGHRRGLEAVHGVVGRRAAAAARALPSVRQLRALQPV